MENLTQRLLGNTPGTAQYCVIGGPLLHCFWTLCKKFARRGRWCLIRGGHLIHTLWYKHIYCMCRQEVLYLRIIANSPIFSMTCGCFLRNSCTLAYTCGLDSALNSSASSTMTHSRQYSYRMVWKTEYDYRLYRCRHGVLLPCKSTCSMVWSCPSAYYTLCLMNQLQKSCVVGRATVSS